MVGLNYLADPFGVFPGRFLEWPGYEMTINPRAAKLTYLKTRSQEYDSYLIGCSSTSSYPVEKLNQYLDARFYNMIMYGADMLDVEQIARRLIETTEVKNLVVNLYIDNAIHYDTLPDPRSFAVPRRPPGRTRCNFTAASSSWTPATPWTSCPPWPGTPTPLRPSTCSTGHRGL